MAAIIHSCQGSTDEQKPRSAPVRRRLADAKINGLRCSSCPVLAKSKSGMKRPCCGQHLLVRG